MDLHATIILLGFSAVLGKLIEIDALSIVWHRMSIAFVAMALVVIISRKHVYPGRQKALKLLGVGLIVAFHWITFFHAVKLSNVAVTLGCFGAITLFTSLLEPVIEKRKLSWLEVVLGLLILAGLYVIFRYESRFVAGILMAVFSAFLASLLTVLNKRLIQSTDPYVLTFYQMFAGVAGITVFALLFWPEPLVWVPRSIDYFYLLILGIVITAYAFMALMRTMKVISAYTVALTINLEPVYGIILAYLIFQESERMTAGFYAGASIVILTVFAYPVLQRLIKR
ncbi:MAG: EamA family transporter [Bacteroidetes bacterium]|nr:EamA family transporter [Bacteroidota bacterium]